MDRLVCARVRMLRVDLADTRKCGTTRDKAGTSTRQAGTVRVSSQSEGARV